MSSDVETGPETTSPGFELLRVAALLGIFAGQLYLASRVAKVPPGYCFTRPFWLDEFHTLAVVKEERADQLLLKLSRGGDLNPPGLHLVLWLISKVTSLSDELLLRSFSCAVGLGGLIATYFLLRIRFPWRVSWVAVLGMWSSSPQLTQQMFEGRTYSFWFATVAILCLLLGLRATGIWQVVCVAAVAAMMCSIHYFGIITIGLIIVSQFCCNLRDTRQRWLIGAALASGVITLIASLPVYFRQRAAVPVPTWIPPPTLGACGAFIEEFSLSYAMTLPILAYALQVPAGAGFRRRPVGRRLGIQNLRGSMWAHSAARGDRRFLVCDPAGANGTICCPGSNGLCAAHRFDLSQAESGRAGGNGGAVFYRRTEGCPRRL